MRPPAVGLSARAPSGDQPPPPLPTFLIIGAQKGGTRWLRSNLAKHPDVFALDSEASYFNSDRYHRGLSEYRRSFAGWDGESAVGEATPGYMIWRHRPSEVASRIASDLPGVKLFAILRNPVDRLYSAFIHHMRRKRIAIDEGIVARAGKHPPEEDPQQLVAGGWYARSLAPYVELFGDRLKVFLNEDARARPRELYREALGHLGLDPTFAPNELEEVVFSRAAPPRSPYRGEQGGRRPLTSGERAALGAYYVDEIERLEGLLGRDLSVWKAEDVASEAV